MQGQHRQLRKVFKSGKIGYACVDLHFPDGKDPVPCQIPDTVVKVGFVVGIALSVVFPNEQTELLVRERPFVDLKIVRIARRFAFGAFLRDRGRRQRKQHQQRKQQ